MNFTPILTANAAVQLHIAAVLIAIAAALFIFATGKGSYTHKIVGRIGALALVIAALSSFGINSLSDPYFGLSVIHLFSCMVLVFIPYGVIQIRKGNISAHRKAMSGVAIGGLGIAGAFTLLPGRMMAEVIFG
ncbi:MAG: DUF2306 domain-containing protein [Pikeienuella sp.]